MSKEFAFIGNIRVYQEGEYIKDHQSSTLNPAFSKPQMGGVTLITSNDEERHKLTTIHLEGKSYIIKDSDTQAFYDQGAPSAFK